MRHFISAPEAFFILLFAALCAGCSPVAWAPRETPHTSSIDIGERVTLLLRDGSVLNGTFAAIRDLSGSEYATYYASGTKEYANQASLPALGQSVTYTTSLDEAKLWKGELVGFDQSSLLLASPSGGRIEKVYFSSLGSISGREGTRIRRMSLRAMFLHGEIPLKTAVVIAGESGEMRIPLSEIEKIRRALPGDATGASASWLDARQIYWASR